MRTQHTIWKTCIFGLAILAPGLLLAAAQNDPVAARWHFAGGTQLTAQPAGAKLKQLGAQPATVTFRGAALNTVAVKLAGSLGRQLNPSSADSATLLRPLLDDVLGSESVAVFGGRAELPLGFVLAIRLDDARAKLWQDNFTRVLGAAPEKAGLEGFTGSVWRKASFRMVRAKGWLVVGRGEDLVPNQNEYLKNIAQQGNPAAALKTDWLELDADWNRLAAWLPLNSVPFTLGRTDLSVSSKGDSFKTVMHVRYSQPLQWSPAPWKIPTALIRDPLSSFTACQDVAPFLKRDGGLSQISVNPFAGQMFVWASEGMPFATMGAVPVSNATNTLLRLTRQLPEFYNPELKKWNAGDFVSATNGVGLLWRNMPLPFFNPSMQAVRDRTEEFLYASVLNMPPRGKRGPEEMFNQLRSHKNLAYYDWEFTGVRLTQWRALSQVLPVLGPFPSRPHSVKGVGSAKGGPPVVVPGMIPPQNPILDKWFDAVAAAVGGGNAVTQVTRTAPNELTLERKSDFGFTGIEIFLLSNWLAGAN